MPTIVRLETIDDPRIADYMVIGDPELVRRRGLFVAEGRLVIERLINATHYAIQSLLLSEAALTAMQGTVDALEDAVLVYVGAPNEMMRLTGRHFHRGCLALVERPVDRAVDELIETAATVVVLEAIGNPDNVGGIFRNAAAFGADAVLLSPTCCDPLYRKAIRTSMGATLRVPYARVPDWPADLRRLRAAGCLLVALTPRIPSQSIDEFASAVRPARLALMFGSEGDGLSHAASDLADVRLRIPVADDVDSLNVAVAAGIALSRLVRQPA